MPDSEKQVTDGASDSQERRRQYWQANRRLIGVLLTVWAAVSYGCGIVFVEPLNLFSIGHLPLGFWFAQQGSIYVFVVLIFVYAFGMDRLDRKYGVKE
jgi:putative solute:sodium symporter small subunit